MGMCPRAPATREQVTLPAIYIQPQSTQGMTPSTTHKLSPTLSKAQISLHFKLPQSQTSFENAMNAIDADL